MKTKRIILLGLTAIALALTGGAPAHAQDEKKEGNAKPPGDGPGLTSTASAAPPKLSADELEAKFKATLSRATLSGRWCGIKDGKLTPEKEDKYTILGVSKLGNDIWLINARLQYGKKDITVPLPVQVKWAGDTPVIIVDNLGIPSGGSYSARVLIYDKTYAGTWSGGDHAGLLNGIIKNEKE